VVSGVCVRDGGKMQKRREAETHAMKKNREDGEKLRLERQQNARKERMRVGSCLNSVPVSEWPGWFKICGRLVALGP
jgi:hypothetical protein